MKKEIKCDNCGQKKEEYKIEQIGLKYYFICKDCEKLVEEFKETHKI